MHGEQKQERYRLEFLSSTKTSEFDQGEYFNLDNDENRRAILKKQWLATSPMIIFDELHKYPRWKSWIKGVYDTKPPEQNYLVTGSALPPRRRFIVEQVSLLAITSTHY